MNTLGMFGFYFNPVYAIFVAPAVLLMIWAQMRVQSSFGRAARIGAPLSGAAAARFILDRGGCHHVEIEEIGGFLSDHYDPQHKVLRLSPHVYREQSLAAVGIAAHEAGHALQDAQNYAPLGIRNAAVPAAQFGPTISIILLIAGAVIAGANPILGSRLIWAGIIAFSGILFFQLINLPVEFDASNRAKRLLLQYQIIDAEGSVVVRDVLNAAGWTYVAGTLQSLLTLAYYIFEFGGMGQSRDDR